MIFFTGKTRKALFCFVFLANTSLWFPNSSATVMEIILHAINLHEQEYKLHSKGELQGHHHNTSRTDSKEHSDKNHDNCHYVCNHITPLYISTNFSIPMDPLKPLLVFFSLIFCTSLNISRNLFRPPIAIFS